MASTTTTSESLTAHRTDSGAALLPQAGGWVLAVDFGTSNTTAATADADTGPRELLFRLEPRLASAVLYGEDGFAVGVDALAQRMAAPERYVETPKRLVGRGSVLLAGREVNDVDLVGAVLTAALTEGVRQRAGQRPARVLLTHPASWGPRRIRVLTEAWQQAESAVDAAGESPEVALVAEPAAAAAFLSTGVDLSYGSRVAVLDFGGGTVDAAVVERSADGSFALVGRSDGLDPLGGVDFDHALFDHVLSQVPAAAVRLASPTSLADRYAALGLLDHVRMAKEALSERPSALVQVPPLSPDLPDGAAVQVTQAELLSLISADLDRAVELLERVCLDTGAPSSATGVVAAADETAGADVGVEAVYLIGGTSRIPHLAGLVAQRIGVAPSAIGDPQLAVALGAAGLGRRQLLEAEGRSVSDGDGTAQGALGESSPISHQPGSTELDLGSGDDDSASQSRRARARFGPLAWLRKHRRQFLAGLAAGALVSLIAVGGLAVLNDGNNAAAETTEPTAEDPREALGGIAPSCASASVPTDLPFDAEGAFACPQNPVGFTSVKVLTLTEEQLADAKAEATRLQKSGEPVASSFGGTTSDEITSGWSCDAAGACTGVLAYTEPLAAVTLHGPKTAFDAVLSDAATHDLAARAFLEPKAAA